jgi:hypothetical protein
VTCAVASARRAARRSIEHVRSASGEPDVVDFCIPGVPRPTVPGGPPPELLAPEPVLDDLQALELSRLSGPAVLALTRGLLAQQQRLHATTLGALSELDRRQLFALDGAGSTRGWLAQQPTGRPGPAAEATRLARRPLLRAAVSAGRISADTADLVATARDRLPDTVEDDQLLGVLRYGIAALLVDRSVDPAVMEALADQALAAVGLDPAQRLEPACVLLAQHLPPTTLAHQLRTLIDALQPERLAEQTRQAWLDQALHIRTLSGLGVEILIRLDDTLGQLTDDALVARLPDDATAIAIAILAALDRGTSLTGVLTDVLTDVLAPGRSRKRATAPEAGDTRAADTGGAEADAEAAHRPGCRPVAQEPAARGRPSPPTRSPPVARADGS